MSRSYKKSPVCTDGKCGTTKDTKRKANHKVRQYNKHLVYRYLIEDTNFENQLTLNWKHYKKIFPTWDIHDWIEYWSEANARLQYEHPTWYRNYDKYATVKDFINKSWKKHFYRK